MTSTAETLTTLDRAALDRLFEGAHTTNSFTDEPVDLKLLQEVYEDLRWAPTSMNIQPLRLTVLESEESRRDVVEHLTPSNRTKTLAAPLSIVAAFDPEWHEHMPHLAPQREGAREKFGEMPKVRESMGRSNGQLQVGYLLLALRAHGLEVGPMTGLDADAVDSVVHAENGWKTLAVINVGHAPNTEDEQAQRPRAGRLNFAQAAQVL